MSSDHLQDVSDDELAIIRKFGKRYRSTHESIMTIGELLPTPPGPPGPTSGPTPGGPSGEDRDIRQRQVEVIDKLMNRGWLVTNSTLYWDQRSDCILLGEGLDIARRLAGHGDIPDHSARNKGAHPHSRVERG